MLDHNLFEQRAVEMFGKPALEIRQGLRVKPCAVGIGELADEGKGRDVGYAALIAAKVTAPA